MDAQEILLKIWEYIYGFLLVVYWYLEALYRQFVPPSMKSIDGETILVTGAVGGIGKELCRNIVRSGSNIKLVLWDLNKAELETLSKELKGNGVQVYPMAVDISTRENVEKAAKLMKDTVGPVSIIFNNAGIAPNGNFFQLTNDQIQKTIDVNLMSHIWILRELMPDMVLKNHGRIVNICSMGGLKAAPFALPYFASKFAVNGYTEAMKLELQLFKYDGIHLSTVYPYFVQTPLIKSLTMTKESSQKSGLPKAFQVFLTPSEVAKSVVDGVRREYEFIYCPSSIPLIVFFDFLVPNKLRKIMYDRAHSAITFKDAEEQKRKEISYHEVIKAGRTKGQ